MLFDIIITFFVIWLIILNRRRNHDIFGLEFRLKQLEMKIRKIEEVKK